MWQGKTVNERNTVPRGCEGAKNYRSKSKLGYSTVTVNPTTSAIIAKAHLGIFALSTIRENDVKATGQTDFEETI